MKEFARFVTLSPEERQRVGYGDPVPLGTSRPRLFKSHHFPVQYPDGSTGECRYTRLGLRSHQFRFVYQDGKELPCRQYVGALLVGGAPAVEAAGRERAERAFFEAIQHERAFYFARVSLPSDGSRHLDPARYRMTAGKARTLGGKYALCVRIGRHLVQHSRTFETLEEANDAWRTGGSRNGRYVACCNRLDRRWELPRYNPLYANPLYALSGHLPKEQPRKEQDHA
jgi:hypothetical protein